MCGSWHTARMADCPSVCGLQVWYLAGTLVLANTVAAVVVVLVAALILPTHATEEVRPTQSCRSRHFVLLL